MTSGIWHAGNLLLTTVSIRLGDSTPLGYGVFLRSSDTSVVNIIVMSHNQEEGYILEPEGELFLPVSTTGRIRVRAEAPGIALLSWLSC